MSFTLFCLLATLGPEKYVLYCLGVFGGPTHYYLASKLYLVEPFVRRIGPLLSLNPVIVAITCFKRQVCVLEYIFYKKPGCFL